MHRPMPAADESGPASGEDHYRRIAGAIEYLAHHRTEQPSLSDLAAQLDLSESHLQRLFSRWAGISPKRFLQHLTVEQAKRSMQHTGDLLGLSLQVGLSGPGRLHDLFVNMEALSPGEFKRAAAGLTVSFGIGMTPFGAATIAFTARGICHLAFNTVLEQEYAQLRQRLPGACWQRDDEASQALLRQVFHPARSGADGLSVLVSGSNFQIQVWRALLRIPFAGLLSYRQLATLLGRPEAARAVGTAIGRNRIAYLIPCHRVLRESGEIGGYYWGSARKLAITGWEAAQVELQRSD